MTIQYLDSRRLTGLSSDTKPTTLSDNSIFIETDTGKRFMFDGTAWKRTSKFDSLSDSFTFNKQHFVEWFSGKQLPSYWDYTDRNSSNHTGSGMSDSIDGGHILQGNSSGGSAQQTILSFMDKKQFSNTGSVCIAVAKLGATGTNEQGGWGMCGDMPSYWLNGIKINVPQSGNIGFYTMDNSTEHLSDTGVAISTASSYHVYKLEQLNGSSKCSIDGVLKNDVTTGQPTTPMQPFIYSKYDNSAVHITYMECYNT